MASPEGSDRIPVGDRELYVEWYGGEAPTTVIEVGSTVPGTNDPGWQPIVDKLAWEMGVVLYDRAGLGQSDPAPKPRKLAVSPAICAPCWQTWPRRRLCWWACPLAA